MNSDKSLQSIDSCPIPAELESQFSHWKSLLFCLHGHHSKQQQHKACWNCSQYHHHHIWSHFTPFIVICCWKYERELNCKSFGFKKLCRHLITLHYIHEALKYILLEICTQNHQISVHSYVTKYMCIYLYLIQLSYTLFYFLIYRWFLIRVLKMFRSTTGCSVIF